MSSFISVTGSHSYAWDASELIYSSLLNVLYATSDIIVLMV